jgi:hypothetical protein
MMAFDTITKGSAAIWAAAQPAVAADRFAREIVAFEGSWCRARGS